MKKPEEKRYGFGSNLAYIVREQWRFDKFYPLAALASTPMAAAVGVVAAFLPKIVLDCIAQHAAPSAFILKVGLLSLAMVLMHVAESLLNEFCMNRRVLTESALWRPKLFEKAMDMDYSVFVHNETRVLREKARDSLRKNNGTDMYIRVCFKLFSALFGFSAFTAIIVRCSVWFIPVLIVCYLLSALGWFLLQKFRDKLKDERAATTLKIRYVSSRSKDFAAAKDIRVYRMQTMLEKKTTQILRENLALSSRENNGFFLNMVFEDVLKLGVSLGAYAYLIYLKIKTGMTVGDFALYFGAITGFGEWVSRVVDNFTDALEGSHYVSDYRSFLDLPDTMRRTGGKALPQGDALPCAIEFDHVSFTYPGAETETIRDFCLTIRAGERVAIVGDNGAGKSTLVKLLCGLLLPQSGTIRVAGTDIREYDRDEYYTMLATVFQSVNILPATVAKNIALCEEKDIDREKLAKCMRLANIYDKIQSLPNKEETLMVHEIHRDATAFSGGEQQRLLLARALYKESASILILDEPTAALDPIAENDLYVQYSTFAADKTSVYISHRLSSTRFCDRIVLLENGEAAEVGTHDELLRANGKYAAMYRLQSRYYEQEVSLA